MSEPKIAIIGSCVTRDAFPSSDEVAYYSARSSLAVRACPPVAFSYHTEPAGVNGFEQRCVEEDFAKTWLERLPADVDAVVIDLIDERYAIAATERSGFTVSTPYEHLAGFMTHEPAIQTLWDGPAYFRLWEAGAAKFAKALRGRCGAARVLVHRALWSRCYRSAAGTVERFGGETAAQIAWHNARLERLYALLAAAFADGHSVLEIDAIALACEDSPWGLTPFHYIDAYYARLRTAIRQRAAAT